MSSSYSGTSLIIWRRPLKTKAWEDRCNRTGECCRVKVLHDGEIIPAPFHCALFNTMKNECLVYDRRRALRPAIIGKPCLTISELKEQDCLPSGCGYRKKCKPGQKKPGLVFSQERYDALPEQLRVVLEHEWVEDIRKMRAWMRKQVGLGDGPNVDELIAKYDAQEGKKNGDGTDVVSGSDVSAVS